MDYRIVIRKTFNGTLKDALTSQLIRSGDVLLLRGKTFSGDYVSTLNGVTVKPYDDEKPVIDGSLVINGRNTTFTDLEIRFSGWKDRITPNNKWLNINGAGCRVINCHIHDMEGVGFWTSAVDGEMSGNIITNIGRMEGETGYGHSCYCQNATGRKQIANNIMANSFNWGIHAYAESGRIDNLDIVNNINFQAGALSGVLRDDILIGGTDATGIVMDGNCTYGGRAGYQNFGAKTIEMSARGNYFANGWVDDGTVFTTAADNMIGTIGNNVRIIKNANRLHVAIYNEAEANTVDVDVSAYFDNGDTVNAYNAQDYPTDVQVLTVTAGVVTVNMQAVNRTVATPYGWDAPAKSFPLFGAFIMVKQ